MVLVTKIFHFEMAHALWNYDGKCKQLHGHSYILEVKLQGEIINNPLDPKNGMIIDFGDLKSIIKTHIIEVFDHSVVLNKKASEADLTTVSGLFDNAIIVDYQPTCENLVVDFAQKIMPLLPTKVKLYALKLYETATSYAEWYNDKL